MFTRMKASPGDMSILKPCETQRTLIPAFSQREKERRCGSFLALQRESEVIFGGWLRSVTHTVFVL